MGINQPLTEGTVLDCYQKREECEKAVTDFLSELFTITAKVYPAILIEYLSYLSARIFFRTFCLFYL